MFGVGRYQIVQGEADKTHDFITTGLSIMLILTAGLKVSLKKKHSFYHIHKYGKSKNSPTKKVKIDNAQRFVS